jgi:integrase
MALADINAAKAGRLRVTDGRQSLASFLETWLNTEIVPAVEAGETKPRTLEHYNKLVNKYIVPFIGDYALVDLTAPLIGELRNKLRKNLVTDTVNAVLGLLARALRDAVAWFYIKVNPAGKDSVKRARKPAEDEEEPLSEQQVRALIGVAQADTPGYARLAFALEVKAVLGLRLGELLGLRWTDVDLDEGIITIAQQLQRRDGVDPEGVVTWKSCRFVAPKTAASRRKITLPPRLLARWREWHRAERLRAGEFGLVFTTKNGTPILPTNFALLFRRWVAKANKAGAAIRARSHRLRHFCATLLGESGAQDVVVRGLLGHGKKGVTQRYQKSRLPKMREAMAYVEAQLWSAGEQAETGT